MKRTMALLLALVTAFSLIACGKEEDHTHNTAPSDSDLIEETVPGGEDATTDTTTSEQDTTESTVPAQTDEPETTQPSEGTILETTPGNEQSASCSHNYQVTNTKASTCSVAGTRTYTCSKCQSAYTEALALKAHDYADGNCTTPKTCKVCGAATGTVVHSYNNYGYCTVCYAKKPEEQGTITFTANIKSDEKQAVAGVTVNVYTTSTTKPAGSAVTNSNGVATMTIDSHTGYTVVLTDLPEGYAAKESYSFTSATVNITLTTLPVYDPLDHSRAKYKEGDTMEDFTLTDTDDNTYTLSELKKQKKLIILDFWYNNCEPCKSEFPWFQEAMDTYGDDIILLAVNAYNKNDAIIPLREQLGYTFPMMYDSVNLNKGFDVSSFPTTVFITSDGKIEYIHRGTFDSKDTFLSRVKRYL